jgi:hypothetical protein
VVALTVLVEDLGQRTPPGPASQRGLLVGGRGSGVTAAAIEGFERGDVGVQFRLRTRRREVSLPRGAKRRRPAYCRYRPAGYQSWWIEALISAKSR